MTKSGFMIKSKKPYLMLISVSFFIASPAIAWLVLFTVTPKEDYLGYQGIGIALLAILFSFITGLISGIASIYRSETPRNIALISTVLNALAIVALFVLAPG